MFIAQAEADYLVQENGGVRDVGGVNSMVSVGIYYNKVRKIVDQGEGTGQVRGYIDGQNAPFPVFLETEDPVQDVVIRGRESNETRPKGSAFA
jgi:hypothetical protein